MIYIVLGMHKSGTTLMAQILHHSGIDMGADDDGSVSYEDGNHYERPASLALNRRILADDGRLSTQIARPRELPRNNEIRTDISRLADAAAARAEDGTWGFKDPRTCFTYPLWAEALPDHRVIVVYRDPAQSWHRYRMRRQLEWPMLPYNGWRFLESWVAHNEAILEHLAVTSVPTCVVSYGALMTDPAEFARLEAFIGRPLADRRRIDLYRNRPWSRALSTLERARVAVGRRSVAEILERLDAERSS